MTWRRRLSVVFGLLAAAVIGAVVLPSTTLASFRSTTTVAGTPFSARASFTGTLKWAGIDNRPVNSPLQVGTASDWAQLSVGIQNSCAIRTSGTLWCWGAGSSYRLGQNDSSSRAVPTQVGTDSDWSSVSTGDSYGCAIKTNGYLYCWGSNDSGQLGIAASPQIGPARVGTATWTKVAARVTSTCGIQTGGKLYCWGDNSGGQLGLGHTTNVSTPTAVSSTITWSTVDLGSKYACAIKSADQTLWCWGDNYAARLGTGDTSQRNSPTQIAGGGTWRTVSAGLFHGCGIQTSGSLWCWGGNDSSQQGQGSGGGLSLTPQRVGTSTAWTALSGRYKGICALQTGGSAWCWGANVEGQLGLGTNSVQSAPAAMGSASWSVISQNMGNENNNIDAFACGLQTNGTLWCWGSLKENQLGLGTATTLTALPGGGSFTSVSTTAVSDNTRPMVSSCAIGSNGTLWCWGHNESGQVGNGTTDNVRNPVQIGTATTWTSVSAGWSTTCAVRTNGTLWCWGQNSDGQLGVGDTTSRTTPTQVTGTTWTTVSVGRKYACATRSDNTLWCWGVSGAGQTGTGGTTSRTSPVQVGGGAVWSSVSTGYDHACAIRTDRSLWCWGGNGNGQLGTGTGGQTSPTRVSAGTTWLQISAGNAYTCAVRSDKTLWCWGANGSGQLGVGNTTGRSTPVQVGTGAVWRSVATANAVSCAKRTDNSAWCWGDNTFAQLLQGGSASGPVTSQLATAPVQLPGLHPLTVVPGTQSVVVTD